MCEEMSENACVNIRVGGSRFINRTTNMPTLRNIYERGDVLTMLVTMRKGRGDGEK